MKKGRILSVRRVVETDTFVLARIEGQERLCKIDDNSLRFRADPESKALEVESSTISIGSPSYVFDPTIVGTEDAISQFMTEIGYTDVPKMLAPEPEKEEGEE